jgi:hypothetical protein
MIAVTGINGTRAGQRAGSSVTFCFVGEIQERCCCSDASCRGAAYDEGHEYQCPHRLQAGFDRAKRASVLEPEVISIIIAD